MKTNIFLAVALLTASMVAFVGCSKNGDNNNETGLASLTLSGVIDSDLLSDIVKVKVYVGGDKDENLLAESDVTNNEFSVTIGTPPVSALTPLGTDVPKVLKVSNPNAKNVGVSVLSFKENSDGLFGRLGV